MKILFVSLVVLLLISCGQKKEFQNLSKNELVGIKKIKQFLDVYKHIEEVQLENRNDDIPVLKLVGVVFNKKYIIGVTDRVNGYVYVWNHKGKFIGRVGNRGKGPGEYKGINHVYFESENQLGIIDGGLARIHLFTIGEKGIYFDDSIDTGVLFNDTPSRVYVRGDKRIIFFSTGFMTPSVVVMNNKWGKAHEFHYFGKNSEVAYGNAIVDDTYIYLTDGREGYDFVSYSSYCYQYSFDGKLIKKIDTKNKKLSTSPLSIDVQKKIILIEHFDYCTVYDIEFNKIHKYQTKSSYLTKEFNHNPTLFLRSGDMNEYYITGELPKDKNKSLILHFFERRIPE